jgi:hypothetical protein
MKKLDELNENELENGLQEISDNLDGLLLRSKDRCMNISIQILRKEDQSSFDKLIVSALMRLEYLTKAYFELISSSNYMASLHLVRLNLDNILRVYAGFICEDPNEFADSFIDGVSVRDIKDKNNERMHDSYLAREISKEVGREWIHDFYKDMSGFIHFSDKHYEHIFNNNESAYLGDHDNLNISIEERLNMIEKMKTMNEILFSQANSRISDFS